LGDNHEPLPFAFILFTVAKDALRAFRELDGTDLQGRLMHIIPGDERRLGKDEDMEGKTLKQRREIERRKLAGRGGDWGTLFMNVFIFTWQH
jgi:multiple RNA-binding domain-containing protein 1